MGTTENTELPKVHVDREVTNRPRRVEGQPSTIMARKKNNKRTTARFKILNSGGSQGEPVATSVKVTPNSAKGGERRHEKTTNEEKDNTSPCPGINNLQGVL